MAKNCLVRSLSLSFGLVMAFMPLATLSASGKKKTDSDSTALNERQRALHALNRLTFGPRPGDVDKVLAMGVEQWMEQQLAPDKINDGLADGKLAPLRTVKMSPHDLVMSFPNIAMVRAVAEGKAPMPTDSSRLAVYEVQLTSYRADQQKKTAEVKADDAVANAKADQRNQDGAARLADNILALPPQARMNAIVALPIEQRRGLARDLRGPQRDKLLAEFAPDQREAFLAMNGPTGVVTNELQQAKLLRALYTERQLQEVMTDFWINHFNVLQNKDADQYYLATYEREVIRPLALGKFLDLLVATAQSPAMLYYLDNWLSIGPGSPLAITSKGKQGLNENYGRELMELHTVGVDGGYTQKDVTELTRVFTGWTIDHPEQGGGFVFDPKKHEPGSKRLLGMEIKEGGEKEGLQALAMLSKQPATAIFVCTKIARRFVSDTPPATLVERMAKTFLSSDGDIREVLLTMLKSKEFWSLQVYRAKLKTPLEFIVSALRATGAQVDNVQTLLATLNRMNMPVYGWAPPTGYPMTAEAWMNSDALVDRLNFAIQLSNGQVGGVKFDPQRTLALSVLTSGRLPVPPNAGLNTGMSAALALLEQALVDSNVSEQTQSAVIRQLSDTQSATHSLDDPTTSLGLITALILGSPEFQRR
jgi:uncharacterized protein (DUF1800 family)